MCLAIVAAALPQAVSAEWRKAESAHFVVFSEEEEPAIRDAAVRLEKLDALQRLIAGAPTRPSPLKPKVFLLPDNFAVQATMPWPVYGVAGFYDGSIRGPFAVNTRKDATSMGFPAQLVLFHELTHHFMLQYFPAAYPIWYQEGLADFIGSAQFLPDGTAKIGSPVGNRYYSLQGLRTYSWIGPEKLLGAKSMSDVGDRVDLLYAEGWLLTHYLTIQPNRRGQLTRYLGAINAGTPLLEAARQAFGDVKQLDRELRAYARRKALDAKIVRLDTMPADEIRVTSVPAAQAALMLFDIRLHAGIPQSAIGEFASALRRKAASFPSDPFALRLRVEADRLAGDEKDRDKALVSWAKAAPNDPALLLESALLAQDRLVAVKSSDEGAWNKVRAQIRASLRLDRNSPRGLKALADSYSAQGVSPPAEAHNALFMALEMVPQNDELRYSLALDFERRGMMSDAIATIAPAAYTDDDPATGKQARRRELRDRNTYRLAGNPLHETPREMLNRLQPPEQVVAAD